MSPVNVTLKISSPFKANTIATDNSPAASDNSLWCPEKNQILLVLLVGYLLWPTHFGGIKLVYTCVSENHILACRIGYMGGDSAHMPLVSEIHQPMCL